MYLIDGAFHKLTVFYYQEVRIQIFLCLNSILTQD